MNDDDRSPGMLSGGLVVPGLLGGLLVVYFLLPFVAFLSRAGSVDVVAHLSSPAARRAVRNSLLTAPVATAIATGLGVPLAYLLARGSFRGKRLLEAAVVLPLVAPPVVGGVMLLTAVGQFTPLGRVAASLGVPLTDSLLGVVLAQLFVAAPFVILTARAGFAAIDERLEQASRSLGYGPIATFWRVSLPLASGAIVVGVTLTFVRAVGEFGATMMVANNPRTMPTQIWVDFVAGNIDGIVPLTLALLAVTLAVVFIVQRLGRTPAVVDA
ncbi:ABC-type transport system permease protein (probable substrate sulfate/thiosulfate/molybdate) [Natronomonas pharaonis DSM 2160]|uniref:ABC-type transport system permease protein (Probable substrate sulfate/thiosulfate/molybdate) n=1 Tax=Natronomonas pharaonis (strain ATCC 35678 / DSM 2160 / CIP 103997 / JCM 8858 / NBRC 14720 / NCIMB 2260 / Gabara) TaxID=348780 RepID=A0A1U7EXZ0_NATPD|nr:ABC transporter permease [Natronomonas pharaonis]CAI50056.1 ABC-type transport system permease protein (probable substrate sulfate/thiosulfate/molybdate) [Natronomonas pharaonis DSM 2160]